MIDVKLLEDVAHRLSAVLPDGLQTVQQDVEKNFKAILQNTFSKLDLVTRDEFEVQVAVLARTRAKLEALEARVSELEANNAGSTKSL